MQQQQQVNICETGPDFDYIEAGSEDMAE